MGLGIGLGPIFYSQKEDDKMDRFEGVMIVSDCDGTLLNSEHEIPEKNCRAIQTFVEEGGKFIVATGRPKNGAMHILRNLPWCKTPSVFFNGALIYDIVQDRALYADELRMDVPGILHEIQNHFPQVGIEAFTLTQALIIQDHPITRHHFQLLHERPVFSQADQVPKSGVLKLFVTGENALLLNVQAHLKQRFPNAFHAVLSGETFLEIYSKTSSKGTALRELRKMYPQVHTVCAVGDNYNDIPMFQWADRAFIPSNGVEEAKACGTVVCSCDEGTLDAVIRLL